ncbi:MAG: cytochrome b [Sulfurifustis sp.]
MNVVDRVAMPARDTSSGGYTLTAVVLHWVLVAVIFTQIGLGWYMTNLPQGPGRSWYFALHKSLGLTAALLIAARVVWRLTHPAPSLPAWFPAWQARAARLSHRLLYACMIILPIAGYVSAEFYKYPTRFWGYKLPRWGWENELLNNIFSGIHFYTSWVLVALIAVHVAAAIVHARRRDGIFRRILPPRTR